MLSFNASGARQIFEPVQRQCFELNRVFVTLAKKIEGADSLRE